MNIIIKIAKKFDENEYLRFPISSDILNGLVKMNVTIIRSNNNWIVKIINLYIILNHIIQI